MKSIHYHIRFTVFNSMKLLLRHGTLQTMIYYIVCSSVQKYLIYVFDILTNTGILTITK